MYSNLNKKKLILIKIRQILTQLFKKGQSFASSGRLKKVVRLPYNECK